MKIIIAGAGIIGTNLAKSLSEENHEVYLIEADEQVAQKTDEKIDVKVFWGSGTDPEILRAAGAAEADLVIAVTSSDETNLTVCSLAAAFGTKSRIARVRSASLNQALREVGYQRFFIDEIINPEDVAARSIIRAVETPRAREVVDFAKGKIFLRSFDVPASSPLCGLKIEELKVEDFPWPFLIVAILKNNKVVIPKGDAVIEALDRIYVLLPATSEGEFLTFVDPEIRRPKKVIIYGATKTGETVAALLADNIREIVLIEEDPQRAEEVAGKLGNARVINGTAVETDILKECGIEAADVFVATSKNDHLNIVSAVLAKKLGAQRTIIISQQPDYMAIVDVLDINVVINPQFLAVDQILRLVRGKGISSVTKFIGQDAEVLELVAEEGSEITKAPLKNIRFPKDAIVGAVYRGEEVILARGSTHIQTGEPVIVFCQKSTIKKLQELFTHRKGFWSLKR